MYHDREEERESTIKTLKHLVEICKQGEEGFETAAENIRNTEYESLLRNYSQQRAKFASELESEIVKLGGDRDDNTFKGMLDDAGGALHRGWINIKSAVAGGDSEAILAECQTGDKAAVETYEKALQTSNLPANIESLVRRQYADVVEAYNKIKTFKHVAS